MVLPSETPEEVLPPRVSRSAEGRFVGFRDPATGRFVTKEEGIKSLRYNIDRGVILDQFGNEVEAGVLGMVREGVTRELKNVDLIYKPGGIDPSRIQVTSDQDIVERLWLRDKNGNIYTVEGSSGLGIPYKPEKLGGWYRAQLSEALGLPEDARLPTKDLEAALLNKEFIVRTIRTRGG